MTSFSVATKDLRQALASVLPHASPDPDDQVFNRLRVEVGPVNVTVTASTGYTVGHAIVSVLDNHDGEVGDPFDLSPVDVKELLALFKTGKDTEFDQTLRVDVDDQHTTVTDTAGLFDGKALQLPRLPLHESFPDLLGMLGKHIRVAVVGDPESGRIHANGVMLGAFTAAARAYSSPLVIEPVGSGTPRLLVTCGESFIGLLMTIRVDEEDEAQQQGWRASWTERLPASAAKNAKARRNLQPV